MVLHLIARLFGGNKMQALEAGKTAPPFVLKDAGGKSYSLAEALKQGPVLLAFFKVSCPVSEFTLGFLERLHQAIKGQAAPKVWAISQDDARETVAFAREYGLSFPMLLDEEGYPVSNNYGITNTPTLFLVQAGGTVQFSSPGFVRRDIEAAAEEFGRRTGQPIPVFLPGEPIPDYKPG